MHAPSYPPPSALFAERDQHLADVQPATITDLLHLADLLPELRHADTGEVVDIVSPTPRPLRSRYGAALSVVRTDQVIPGARPLITIWSAGADVIDLDPQSAAALAAELTEAAR